MSGLDASAWRPPVAIALGAVGGALCRYYLSQILARWLGMGFPYGTLLANVSGSFVLGWLLTWAHRGAPIAPELVLLAGTGFLGSYTTFSSYTLESWRLFQVGPWGWAGLYWLGSPLLGLLGAGLGAAIAGQPFRE